MAMRNSLEALSFPYRQSREGFFGTKTSTLNFCEEVKRAGPPELLASGVVSPEPRGARDADPSPGLRHDLLVRRVVQHAHQYPIPMARL